MAERSSVTQVVQIGMEVTAGTAVAATKQLTSLMVEPAIKTNVSKFRPSGSKVNTVTAQGKEWTEAKISGIPVYDELQYLFSSILKTTTPATVGVTGKKWTFTPSATTEDVVQTYTVENGSALRAQKFAGGIVTSFGIKFDREGVSVDGSMMGQLSTDGITLTAGTTKLPLIPVLGKEFSVYSDTTGAGLGTTKLTRVLSADFKIANRFGPLWVVDAANTSYAASVEKAIDVELKLLVEADAAGMAFLSRVRDGATRFFRMEALSAQLAGTAIPYGLRMDLAAQATDISDYKDQDGVYAIEFTFTGVQDSTWGNWFSAELTNKQGTL